MTTFNIETRILYAVAFTLLGVVLAVYALPQKSLPEMKPITMDGNKP